MSTEDNKVAVCRFYEEVFVLNYSAKPANNKNQITNVVN
jgi:hypothetical protein